MFADLELIGVPHRVTIGERGLKDGKIEYQGRSDKSAITMEFHKVTGHLKALCG
jgi:prolyl-tRNA synthetase